MSAADHVFGHGHRVHPVTKRPLESGIGALPEHVQAKHHIDAIEHEEGKSVADKMRAELHKLTLPASEKPAEPEPEEAAAVIIATPRIF